ncbi:hypothetical protein ACFSFY_02510 [Sporosarcina siberiensis]|uniref:Uncharacterized protein n=1 Tax=Sporosarcina siberiensis TaxID=1365606 RepID=A0ABW4SBX4_9BACL
MTEKKGVTVSAAPLGRQGTAIGGDVTTYRLKDMSPVLVDAEGLTKYLREHSEDTETTEE